MVKVTLGSTGITVNKNGMPLEDMSFSTFLAESKLTPVKSFI